MISKETSILRETTDYKLSLVGELVTALVEDFSTHKNEQFLIQSDEKGSNT